ARTRGDRASGVGGVMSHPGVTSVGGTPRRLDRRKLARSSGDVCRSRLADVTPGCDIAGGRGSGRRRWRMQSAGRMGPLVGRRRPAPWGTGRQMVAGSGAVGRLRTCLVLGGARRTCLVLGGARRAGPGIGRPARGQLVLVGVGALLRRGTTGGAGAGRVRVDIAAGRVRGSLGGRLGATSRVDLGLCVASGRRAGGATGWRGL